MGWITCGQCRESAGKCWLPLAVPLLEVHFIQHFKEVPSSRCNYCSLFIWISYVSIFSGVQILCSDSRSDPVGHSVAVYNELPASQNIQNWRLEAASPYYHDSQLQVVVQWIKGKVMQHVSGIALNLCIMKLSFCATVQHKWTNLQFENEESLTVKE